jgi:hypothetical protein
MVLTFNPETDWCRTCGKVGCDCPYCHGARFVRSATSPDLLRCDACNPAPEPEAPAQPAPTPIRQRRLGWAERLES